jgi:hypothetical protein
MPMSQHPSRRPPLSPGDVYRPRLGAQNPPRWQIAMREQAAWRAISSPPLCPSQTADADAQAGRD